MAQQLGALGDDRAVYYLAQQFQMDHDAAGAEFRQTAAEAMGRIVGQSFSRDAAGIEAARAWWLSAGIRQHDKLVY